MTTLGYILIFTFIGSIASLVGGLIILTKEALAKKLSHYLFSFAAGVLLGTVFFDLLPEAAQDSQDTNIYLWTLVGILFFFLLVRFMHFFHHHDEHIKSEPKSTVPLLLLGDTIHNFIDGIVIAATFLVSIPLGVVTSLAVAAHEIPQEIGDFTIMLHRGISRKKIILFNLFSASVSMVAAIITYLAEDVVKSLMPVFLSLTAGFFIYIAASDLIPEIHKQEKRNIAFFETVMLFVGVVVIYFSVKLLEG